MSELGFENEWELWGLGRVSCLIKNKIVVFFFKEYLLINEET